MDSIKSLFDELDELTVALTQRATEPDEFIACGDINAALDKARDTFKRTKDIDKVEEIKKET